METFYREQFIFYAGLRKIMRDTTNKQLDTQKYTYNQTKYNFLPRHKGTTNVAFVLAVVYACHIKMNMREVDFCTMGLNYETASTLASTSYFKTTVLIRILLLNLFPA